MKLVSVDKISKHTAIASVSDGMHLFKFTIYKSDKKWALYNKVEDLKVLKEIAWIHDKTEHAIYTEVNNLLTKGNVNNAWNLSFFINADVISPPINEYIIDTVKLNPKDDNRHLIYRDIPANVLAATFIWSVIEKKFGRAVAADVAFSRCNASTLYKVIKANIEGVGDTITSYMRSKGITEDNISPTNLKNYKFYGCVIKIFRGTMRRCKACGRWCDNTFCCKKCYGSTLSKV